MIFVLLFATSFGCARVQVDDSEWCGDMGPQGAACYHTLTDESRDVVKADWDLERVGMLCTRSTSFAALTSALEKLCSLTWRCSYEEKAAIERLKLMVKQTEGVHGP